MKKTRDKFALVHIGNDESYGLLFVAGELIRHDFEIEWFDGDCEAVADKIVDSDPNFVFFSPMTAFFKQSLRLSNEIKERSGTVSCVFGGHHVSAVPECLKLDGVDIVVTGPVYGTIDRIVNSSGKELIHGIPVSPDRMFPSRHEYYAAIPRMARIPRKLLMSHFGCTYNCSYCSTSRLRKHYSAKVYKQFWLTRRPIEHLIREAEVFREYSAKEVELADDDAVMGNDIEKWLEEFASYWTKAIGLPMYCYVTPQTAISVSDKTLEILADFMTSVTMGVQAARRESLKLFNRGFQTEGRIKKAYDRLQAFGIPTRLDIIVGLPVADPVGDALETIRLAQRIGGGTCTICYPLMIYPGTKLYDWCVQNNISLNEECTMEWHTGVGSVKFHDDTSRRLKNIKKLATMFVKYNIDEHWMRAIIDMEMTESCSRKLSECQYYDTVLFRLGNEGVGDFNEILAGIELKY